ncbi:LAMI_0F07008g1_1 [Lachancea mirantina]|uniref:Nucleotide exchange factor SIL1 n=1 Tax=Lachancea mirantina TaxID=1230905 RepID=A0A1G4JZC3_9SACH|nr:LAMI_0F07008g1_1 [Lachancea mirantina]
MKLIWIILPLVAGQNLITLEPEVKSKEDFAAEEQLYVGDSIICDSQDCYPKVFEPREHWQEIKASQHLPAGLDIRMNIESGLREAKLHAGASEDDSTGLSTVEETQQAYEFSEHFKEIRDAEATGNYNDMTTHLETLIEFSHGYHHGYKIISRDFATLERLVSNVSVPLHIKELTTRIFTGCLRNNQPACDLIVQEHGDFIPLIWYQLHFLVNGELNMEEMNLCKRYLSILHVLSVQKNTVPEIDEEALNKMFDSGDKQTRLRVLEIVSLDYSALDRDALTNQQKRNTQPLNAQAWYNKLALQIQDPSLDEFQVRLLFRGLHSIKTHAGKSVKTDQSFVKWLAAEAENRSDRLKQHVKERDPEQEEFDRQLVSSRHAVFGNPLANRIKRFDDEL